MTVAILSIGTELTRGEIVDTNSAWLAAALTEAGFDVGACDTVGDDGEQIVRALKRLGGLGPTTDDITARCAAEAAGVALLRNDEALAAIRRRVESKGRVVTPQDVAAAVLACATHLKTATGTRIVIEPECQCSSTRPVDSHRSNSLSGISAAGWLSSTTRTLCGDRPATGVKHTAESSSPEGVIGSLTVKRLPTGRFSTRTSPPWSSTTFFTIARPRPVPSLRLVS